MKIVGSPLLELNPTPKRTQGTTSSPSPASTSASVVVSNSATTANAAKARVDGEVEQRIEVLKTQVSEGSYQPDLDRLASRLVDEERARAGGGHDHE